MINKPILVISAIGVSALLLKSMSLRRRSIQQLPQAQAPQKRFPRVVNHVRKESWGMLEQEPTQIETFKAALSYCSPASKMYTKAKQGRYSIFGAAGDSTKTESNHGLTQEQNSSVGSRATPQRSWFTKEVKSLELATLKYCIYILEKKVVPTYLIRLLSRVSHTDPTCSFFVQAACSLLEDQLSEPQVHLEFLRVLSPLL